MNRRSFLGNAIAGLAASGFLTQMRGWAQATTNAKGLNIPIGFQSYVFREEISQKPRETMAFLMPLRDKTTRLVLRYAAEKMSEADRAKLLQK